MLLFLFLFGLALGGIEGEYTATLQQMYCPELWISFKNNCYKYVSNRIAWIDAELHCMSEGTHLVSIHSMEEHSFVKALIKKSDTTQARTWIGLSDIHKDGTWLWSDGTTANFLDWSQGEPNNYNGQPEQCAQTNFGSQKKWNDEPCSRPFAFVCKSGEIFGPA